MKNLLLTVLLVFSFAIVLFLEGAPQRGEFVAEVNTTLIQLSQDLPALTSAPAKRIDRSGKTTVVDSLLANVVARSIPDSDDCTWDSIAISEPDCGGWND